MVKHNKKRNTAFIYEALVREIIKQSVNKNTEKRNIAIKIVKESFAKKTELRKELILYKILLETKNLNEKIAEKLLYEVVHQYKRIDCDKLFKEQSIVISQINKKISKEVFNNFVPSYKNLATIAQIFSNLENPKTKVLLEAKLIANLVEKKEQKIAPLKVSNLIVKTFSSRFNNGYKELLEEQKNLLSKYVSSFQDNGTEFKFYINEEIGRLKKVIKEAYNLDEIKLDEKLKTKLKHVSDILSNFNKKPIGQDSILQVMKIQNLSKELEN